MTTASDNLHTVPLTLRLDPWTPTYESAVRLEEEDADAVEAVRTDVETDAWRVITPGQTIAPESIFFIDGVRRVDVGIIDEADGGLIYGLLGTFAAGVTSCSDGVARIYEESVGRRVILGAGKDHETIRVPAGGIVLEYMSASADENTRAKVMAQLQVLMRKEEGKLAVMTADDRRLTFVDGPLTYMLPLEKPILGYVKTHSKYYVTGEQLRVVQQLQTGQRTPVFQFGTDHNSRYSWYVCVGPRRELDHSLAGVIRVEVSAMIGAAKAIELADCSTTVLPRFATTPAWDPRAPQNLYPVSALESHLHHRMGDREYVRRSITVHFRSLLEMAA